MKDSRLAFGSFRIDPVAQRLWRGSQALPLAPKPVALLYYLAQNAGRLVTKRELLDHVWPGVHVCDAALKNNIAAVRDALGDTAGAQAIIETQARRGYRFMAPIDRGDLPERFSPLIGRREEVRRAVALIARRHLVTLTGPPGSGKSALADAVARHIRPTLSEGVWWVDLCAGPGRLSLERLTRERFGLPAGPRQATFELVRRVVEGRQLFIVLDGCDAHRSEVGQFAKTFLDATADVHLLLTAWAPMGVPGEQVMAVHPMVPPDRGLDASSARRSESIKLFEHRARQAKASFVLSERNVGSVTMICRRVEGLPSAIAQAAEWVNTLTPDEILARLDDLLAVPLGLGTSDSSLSVHDRFSRAITLIPREERSLLRRISELRQPFTLRDVGRQESGQRPGSQVSSVALLEHLVRRSLVLPVGRFDSGASRYRVLEPLREYMRRGQNLDARG